MNYPRTGSLLESRINSGLSTSIIVKVNNTTVGAIQRLSVNQNRDMVYVEEIGTDGVVEIHPRGATKIELQLERVVFDGLRITEAFARGFVNIQSQRVPFDINVMDMGESKYESDYIVHTFNNCWFRQYNPQFRADSFIVSENAQVVCEFVSTMRNGVNASQGGLRGILYEKDSIERNNDINGKRGKYEIIPSN